MQVLTTLDSTPHGLTQTGFVGPNIATVGTPEAAAICMGPESLLMKRRQFLISDAACLTETESTDSTLVASRKHDTTVSRNGFSSVPPNRRKTESCSVTASLSIRQAKDSSDHLRLS